MAFPNKMYFSLNEVSKRWNRKMKDVEYCIENGLLNAHIKVYSVKLAPLSHNANLSEYEFTGCKCLVPEDCHILFRHNKKVINEFLSHDCYNKERLIQPEELIVTRIDLMILLNDLIAFEQKYNLGFHQSELPLWDNMPVEPINNIAVSNDCDIIYIGNTLYSFGHIQAKIIRELHKAAQTNNPWLLGKNLLVDSGARTVHLKDLFKSHPMKIRFYFKYMLIFETIVRPISDHIRDRILPIRLQNPKYIPQDFAVNTTKF